ncbi:PQQ-binding-like beta-propeller repeat protein [Natronosalvus rutilus]|uniref:PQQ-like beta-propeller repeat protein n=1 Tax=Natronosalvus rutilus TaxID=2953753 RepID=A0A9E7NAW4_9EURY|nr:PQQ-binding-like beta-propeller repeat protein [Natronosalvus rutilus]UTF54917.1 PQQ-like beta-propeller repeat protein [Natronosalvus rutilus]
MPSTRRSVLAACTAGVGALAGCISTEKPTADGSWPRRTLTNAHTGHSTTEGPTTDLHTVWHRERPRSGVVNPSPVVDDGVLYFAYAQESRRNERGGAWVEAFDAATGDSRWTTELFRTDEFHYFYHSDSTVVDGNRLFLQTRPGLTMLTTDGEIQWTFENLYRGQQRPDVVTPVVTDDGVVTGTYGTLVEAHQEEVVYGIDPATGDKRWSVPFPEWAMMWQLVGTDDVVYVPFLGDGLVALDVATGAERWRWEGPINGTPTVVDDLLLVPLRRDDEYALVAMDRRDRSLRWQQSIGSRWPDAQFTVADGLIYHVANFGFEARRLETGKRVWRFGGDAGGEGEPAPDEPQVELVSTPSFLVTQSTSRAGSSVIRCTASCSSSTRQRARNSVTWRWGATKAPIWGPRRLPPTSSLSSRTTGTSTRLVSARSR